MRRIALSHFGEGCLLLPARPRPQPPTPARQTSIHCQHCLVTIRKDIPGGKQSQQTQTREAEISKSVGEPLAT
ncbi:mCG142648, isoform CRA_a [Mus musculus]|nr:mCG142648, isoform CRA_a [Mus musculus]